MLVTLSVGSAQAAIGATEPASNDWIARPPIHVLPPIESLYLGQVMGMCQSKFGITSAKRNVPDVATMLILPPDIGFTTHMPTKGNLAG